MNAEATVENFLNAKSMPIHQKVVVVWQVLILILLVWAFFSWRDDGQVHWLWFPLFALPVIVIFATFANMQGNHRSVAYWVLAAVTIPTAASGLTSIIGWMFVVSLVLLIWAARRENPAEEMVQM